VNSGDIVFPATASVTVVSQPTTAAPAPKAEKSQVVTTDFAEAKTITYESPSRSFIIEVQHVLYTKHTFGSSSLSGLKKALQ
jgi:hypothetical protein